MNKKYKKIFASFLISSIMVNIIACNSITVTSDNIGKDKLDDNKEPDNNKDENKPDPDKVKKDYDENWNWKHNEKEIMQFIKNFQIEVKDRWLELADENPILDDDKNLLTITYKQEDLDKEFKENEYYNSGEWLVYERFITQIAKNKNWIIDGYKEKNSNKIYKKNLLYKNQWHKNISRNEKKYGGDHSDGIWIGFEFREAPSKNNDGTPKIGRIYERFLNYYIVSKNNSFLTLCETEFFYSAWDYQEKDKNVTVINKDKFNINFILDYYKNL